MEKFSTEYFRKLASDLKFSLTDEEIEALKKDFEAVEAQVHLFEQVDTEGVEPMIWPFETPTVFLRETWKTKPWTRRTRWPMPTMSAWVTCMSRRW